MITGTVNANREATLSLTLRNNASLELNLNTLVDTGFNGWLTLPPDIITVLALPWQRYGRAQLADGSEKHFDIYEVSILWDGQTRTISVYEMDAEPLLGMSMMYGFELLLPVLDGATFTIRKVSAP
jgi:clan AA aspartic protease